MKRNAVLIAVIGLLVAACASMRKVDVTSDPNQTYAINVYNARGGAVVVSYSDGNVTRELGEVGSGDTERFVVVASPSNPRITVIARTASGTSLPSQSVSLSAGQTRSVTIR